MGGPKTGNQYLKGEAEEPMKETEASDSDRRDRPRRGVFGEAREGQVQEGIGLPEPSQQSDTITPSL